MGQTMSASDQINGGSVRLHSNHATPPCYVCLQAMSRSRRATDACNGSISLMHCMNLKFDQTTHSEFVSEELREGSETRPFHLTRLINHSEFVSEELREGSENWTHQFILNSFCLIHILCVRLHVCMHMPCRRLGSKGRR